MSVLLLFFVSSEEMLFIICESLKAICSIICPKPIAKCDGSNCVEIALGKRVFQMQF